ncbi:helix-turn-helix transcriptional regulator [Brachybacterium sp. J153]|uniref:helix-turn-helix transcriptional regulator n=1 Tax=Brachybacterium sp. J153 TaxID=3116488 RepID=UPI002E79D5D1|nr:helix-turn-helix domain-containing protein [Brachybacterium sp. J153]MEE1617323.1 helix-turn-helix domain-containing protein [Brachybacterium sp. J153]
MTHTTAPAMLTEQDVVNMTGLARGTLAYWRHAGQGPRSYKLGRRVRYDESDVLAWIQQQKAATSRGGI